ncbi:hypothetical protein BGZ94_007390 [Podila epigama]|nr:hypothetical protein BGZ94_007390 [Podila epigama]
MIPPRPLRTELRRNISLPDLKASMASGRNGASSSASSSSSSSSSSMSVSVSRGTSLPLRQRVYPYHFMPLDESDQGTNSTSTASHPTPLSNPRSRSISHDSASLPVIRTGSVRKQSGLSHSQTFYNDADASSTSTTTFATYHKTHAPPAYQDHPSIDAALHTHSHSLSGRTTPSSSFNHSHSLGHHRTQSHNVQYDNHHNDHLQHHHHQQRTRRLTRHRAFSQESLPGYIDTRPFIIPEPNKDLPPTPPGSASPVSPRSTNLISQVISPFSPTASSSLKRQDSIGVIPQDASRSMDQKTLQKVIDQAAISSRVYKVMDQDQIDSLRKEQEEVQHFIESLNVSLHIETRMRDASHSLIRLHESSSNMDAVKAATEQLNSTTRTMDQIVQKIQQSMWRLMAIQKMLLQHEGAVLNVGMRKRDSENRDLSRAVRHLEEAHDQEKKEKLHWKERHAKLKVQSILLQESPRNPILESDSSMKQGKQGNAEAYIKELQDEIVQSEEREIALEKKLQAVSNWVDDMSLAVDLRSPSNLKSAQHASASASATASALSSNKDSLQQRLQQLQFQVESEFKRLDARVEDWKSLAEAADLAEEDVPKRHNLSKVQTSNVSTYSNDHRLLSQHSDSELLTYEKEFHSEKSSLQSALDDALLKLEQKIFGEPSLSSRPTSSSTIASSIASSITSSSSSSILFLEPVDDEDV